MFKKYLHTTTIWLLAVTAMLFLAVLITFLTGKIASAEKILSYLWLFLALVAGISITALSMKYFIPLWIRFDTFILQLYTKYNQILFPILKNKSFLLVLSLCMILFSGLYPYYNLGGDDTRLYYLYPSEFFNFTLRVGPDTAVSSLATFLPPSSLTLFAGLLLILKTLVGDLNLQSMLYTANIICGMWGFYVLAKYLIGNISRYSTILRIIFSFIYVFSIFIFYTLLNSQLIALFLLSTFPLSLYLYIRGIQEDKKYLLVSAALIWTVFCYFSVSLPWFAAIALVCVPLLVYYFRRNIPKFINANIFFGLLLIAFNLHWIAATPFTYAIGSSSTVSGISSQNFRSQNEQGIRSVSEQNTVFYPFVNTYHADIQKNYNWPYLSVFTQWYGRIILLNCLWMGLLLYALRIYKKTSLQHLPIVVLFCFLIAVYFFTAKIGNWGLPLFVWLSNSIPGFVMFRNMYDKFGFALSFVFALSMLSFTELIYKQHRSGSLKRLILIGILTVAAINGLPYLLGKFQSLPIWTTQNSYSKLRQVNSDYLALTSFVKQQASPSRYLWLPLNYGNVSQIQDEYQQNFYYNGTSPFIFFSEHNDYSGILSFERHGQQLADDIRHRRFANVGLFFQRFNVGYIIVNNTLNEEIRNSYLCGEGLCALQDEDYKKAILGRKIKDFGVRYSLYEIHPSFANTTLYATDTVNAVENKKTLSFRKVNEREYSVHVDNVKSGDIIVFLQPFFSQWHFIDKTTGKAIHLGQHIQIFDYANAWVTHSGALNNLPASVFSRNADGTVNLDLFLQFELGNIYYVFFGISYVSIICAVLYLLVKPVYAVIKKRYEEKK